MFRKQLILGGLLLAVAGGASAEEIGFKEDFALARDRVEALQQLIPGTQDYYFYHCLHFQNLEQFDKVEQFLADWIKRYNYTPLVRQIQHRQALLTYAKDPQKSLEYLRNTLNLRFNHQREVMGQKPDFPTVLDEKLIQPERLKEDALKRYKNLDGFEDQSLSWLAGDALTPERRRALLSRLTFPRVAGLPQLIADDLAYRNSRGFGLMPIHGRLMKSQLDELVKLRPQLQNQQNFVNTYLIRLRPGAEEDWRLNRENRLAYLERLWSYVKDLAPAHNSLKVNVLYQRLLLDREAGEYDLDRFMTYLRLPRQVNYINPRFLQSETNRRFTANLGADFRAVTGLPVVGNDEALVRSYLLHFFKEETTTKPFEPYINSDYLKHTFAEAKIVNGLGDAEQWYSMLPPAKYQQLKQRVDLDFAYTNRRQFRGNEAVRLDVDIKNVETLIVKVFEINTLNYYERNQRLVDTDINLDGLVPNVEKTHQYEEAAVRRVRRHFEFPQLKKPGVYVIDFIGNGKSSRAVIRKGRMSFVARTGTAGQAISVFDENRQHVKDATIRLGGRQYKSNDDGIVTIPFSANPGSQPMVISHAGFHWLDWIDHEAESYSLQAGFYVDRESLLKRNKATLLVRPQLLLNGTPVTLSVLQDVRLILTSTDQDGVETTKEVSDFPLFEDRESEHEFLVPDRLSTLQFSLQAKVKNLSQNKDNDLAVSQQVALNGIDKTDKVQDLHFVNIAGSHELHLLGRNGEPMAHRPVNLQLKHRLFKRVVSTILQTDASGRVTLGPLPGIVSVTAQEPSGVSHVWPVLKDRHTHYQSVNGIAGEPIEIPIMNWSDTYSEEASLIELRGGNYFADRSDRLEYDAGLVRVAGLDAGLYEYFDPLASSRISVRVVDGKQNGNYVLGSHSYLELRGSQPLQISTVTAADEEIKIQLANSSDFARVHVFATRYRPSYDAYSFLATDDIEPLRRQVPDIESLYFEGRKIGDEYQYIIDRKYARKFPGNMLERPSLLLNPWPLRSTDTEKQEAEAGRAYGGKASDDRGRADRQLARKRAQQAADQFANLDFLARQSAVVTNLRPDDKGVITIDRVALGTHQEVVVVALDANDTVIRTIRLPETVTELVDLRLMDALDPDKHFSQQQSITVVPDGRSFIVDDISSARFETYPNLSRVYTLYSTLLGDNKLEEFRFVVDWNSLKDEEKREKYSKYACHELNFFLYHKDREFYRAVVLPYLANKLHKTFLDQWLLEQSLEQFRHPYQFRQLNIVESILLGSGSPEQTTISARHVQDLFDLLPPDVDRLELLFETAVRGRSLEADAEAMELLERAKAFKSVAAQPRFAAPAAAPSGGGGFGGGGGGRGRPGNRPATGAAGLGAAGPGADANQGGDRFNSRNLNVDAFGEAAPAESSMELSRKLAELNEKVSESRAALGTRRVSGRLEADKKVAREYFNKDRSEMLREQLYQKLDATKEWVENNYYRLPIESQNAELVEVNRFWLDYARHENDKPFLSVHFGEASRNFTEVMMAMAVLDLPETAPEQSITYDKARMTINNQGPMIVYHEEIRPAEFAVEQIPILVSQNYFREGDRYQQVNGEKRDKFVTDEFLMSTVYGCQVVVTNPTSTRHKLDLLLQIPEGAIAVKNGRATNTEHVVLDPYRTQAVEYFFYFPEPGNFTHYPVHVSQNAGLVAHAESDKMNVVAEPTKVDRKSWQFVSQEGTDEEVLEFLQQENLYRVDLSKIAFRMKDAGFFRKATAALQDRRMYNDVLWSYSVQHNEVPRIKEYLANTNAIASQVGPIIDSPLLTIDPVERKTYQQIDYRPLVNARAHQLGKRRQILNDRLYAQYMSLMNILCYERTLDDQELMVVTYYLLLQDRVEEALQFFGQVNGDQLPTRLQYDYFAAYMHFYQEEPGLAREIAAEYESYPVPRWRKAFESIVAQVDEIEGQQIQVVNDEDRNQRQTQMAAQQPTFDFKVESQKVTVDYQNIEQVVVNYYLMDIELLFSRNPFVQQYSGQFSNIKPNRSAKVDLPAEKSEFVFDLPKELHSSNVLVEVVGAGQTRTQAYYANTLSVQMMDNFGQLQVSHRKNRKAVPKVYVKVYARMKDGAVRFYKDGYTDLRGRFDYTSLNTNELDFVDRFAVLILSDDLGAVVREVAPPKR